MATVIMKQQPLKDPYKYGFHEEEKYIFKSKKGLDAEVVASISGHKNEPEWMREKAQVLCHVCREAYATVWRGSLDY